MSEITLQAIIQSDKALNDVYEDKSYDELGINDITEELTMGQKRSFPETIVMKATEQKKENIKVTEKVKPKLNLWMIGGLFLFLFVVTKRKDHSAF